MRLSMWRPGPGPDFLETYGNTAPGPEPSGTMISRAALWYASAALAIPSLVLLLGWLAGLEPLVRVAPNLPAMAPVTCLALILAACGSLLANAGAPALRVHLCSLAVLVLALRGRATALLSDPARSGEQVSILTEIGLSVLALGLSLQVSRLPGRQIAAQAVATCGLIVLMVPLLGHLYMVPSLTAIPGVTEIGLHTTATLILLCLAQLALGREVGWVRIYLASGTGSRAVRLYIPLLILATLVYVSLALYLALNTGLSANFRVAVFSALMILTLGAVGLALASKINRLERRAGQLEAILRAEDKAQHASAIDAERLQRMEALAALVGGVAHDFNNTLAVIRGNLELLELTPVPADQHDSIGEAIAATDRGATLTRQLLAYGAKAPLAPETVEVGPLIGETMQMFRRLTPSGLRLRPLGIAAGAQVRLDGGAFCQALLNLLVNARDASGGQGVVYLRCRVTTLGARHAARFDRGPRLVPGRYLIVQVGDRGKGMDPETLRRATEPFFTTKAVGKGTGLGLSSVLGFCTQSGGGLAIASRPGRGTVVSMAFPAADATDAQGPARAATPAEALPPTDILLVEDDPAVRRFMIRSLQMSGHSVAAVPTAEEALHRLEAGPLPKVLITDVGLPGAMQGDELARQVARMAPGIDIVIVSGNFADADIPEPASGERGPVVLQKPFDRGRLMRALTDRSGALSG